MSCYGARKFRTFNLELCDTTNATAFYDSPVRSIYVAHLSNATGRRYRLFNTLKDQLIAANQQHLKRKTRRRLFSHNEVLVLGSAEKT